MRPGVRLRAARAAQGAPGALQVADRDLLDSGRLAEENARWRPRAPRRTTLAALAILVASALAHALSPLPHGGVYRGPGGTVPPPSGPAPSSPAGPGSGSGSPGSAGSDPDSWATWWAYRRDPYLALKAAVHADDGGPGSRPVTGAGGFGLGRGESTGDAAPLRPSAWVVTSRVVPALRRALGESDGVDLRSACLLALAKIGEDPAGESLFEVLVGHLDDPVQEIGESAALALGLSGHERALFLLADLLDDRESARKRLGGRSVPTRTRAFAAYALGLGAARSVREDVRRFAVSRLAASLSKERFASADVPVAVIQALGLVRLETLGEADAEDAVSASRSGQVRHLIALLERDDLDARVRAHVPGSLAALLEGVEGSPAGDALKQRVATRLVALLEPHADATAELRQGAVVGLQLLGDADADAIDRGIAQTLRRAARDFEPLTRGLALVALGDSAARAGARAEDPAVRRDVRSFLLARLGEGTTMTRPWAAFALAVGERRRLREGRDADPDLARALRGALAAARSPEERTAMSLALGLIEDVAARAPVQELFGGPGSDDVRGTFAVALGLLRAPAAVEPLSRTVRESRFRPGLLRDAAVGLALIGDKGAVPMLAGELADAGSLASQAALCAALGTVGDARAVETLIAFLGNDEVTSRARAFAAAALGNVADPAPLPFNSPIAGRVVWRSAPETLIDPAGGRGILDLY